jgi:hypothetical protein
VEDWILDAIMSELRLAARPEPKPNQTNKIIWRGTIPARPAFIAHGIRFSSVRIMWGNETHLGWQYERGYAAQERRPKAMGKFAKGSADCELNSSSDRASRNA